MKNLLSVFLLCFACTVFAQDAADTGPLVFDTPPGWTVTYQNPGGAEIYNFTHKDPLPMKVLMISRWPAGGTRESVPALVETLAKAFASQAETAQLPLKTTDYSTKDIVGDAYSGQYAGFVMDIPGDTPQVQTLFMIGGDQGLWNGQYTGPIENWKEILKMLRTVKNRTP